MGSVVRHSSGEEGQALLAWSAVLAFFVIVPLLALVGDGSRIFFVRNRLQTALDAACEDAAWSAADRAQFRETGTVTFLPAGVVVGIADATFYTTLVELGAANYSASIQTQPEFDNLRVFCSGQAVVPLLVADYKVSIDAVTASSIRFR